MSRLRVCPTNSLSGSVRIPASKSHSIRAVLYGALAEGDSCLLGLLNSPDVAAMKQACVALGAQFDGEVITGFGKRPKTPSDVIDAGNSGLVLRFIGAITALADGYSVITGDASIRSRRPAQPLLDGITQLGGFAVSTRRTGLAPLVVGGQMRPGYAKIAGSDSQPVSALLTAAALMEGTTTIEVTDPGELPWIDLSLSWLKRLGVTVRRDGYTRYEVDGIDQIAPFEYEVPGDFSSATFPLAAAAITGSKVTVSNLDRSDAQGDQRVIDILEQMGATVSYHEQSVTLQGTDLEGIEIDVNDVIDAIPILAVIGCYANGQTHLYNGKIARLKESDRISAICTELKKMGGDVEEKEDGLIIRPSALKGVTVESYHDHRIAMSLAVAALGAKGDTCVQGVECIQKTFPNFVPFMQQLGAQIALDSDRA